MKDFQFVHQEKIYQIHCGNNARENWRIIDQAEPNDLWFHLQNYPSAHVILEVKTLHIPLEVMSHCAQICREQTHARKNNKDSVEYTEIKYIKKTDILGQVTTKNLRIVNSL